MPKVSVIIPVYNSEPYLRQSLDSVVGQTFHDIEVLCVDDGSTDGSYSILSEYAERDKRVRLFRQPNSGAGVARNYGLKMAKGEFLSFLDSDDFFEPTTIEDTYNKIFIDNADICFYKTRLYNNQTGESRPAIGFLKTELLPEHIPFNPAKLGDNIFFFTTPVPWDQLFRRDFISCHGLKFQPIKRANDLFFTYSALLKAQRITVMPKELVNHRASLSSSLQATNHETFLDFYTALIALKKEMIKAGEYKKFERAFVNEAIRHCLYNLRTIKECNAFFDLYHKIKNEILTSLEINGRDEFYFLIDYFYNEYQKIKSQSPQEYLFEKFLGLQTQLRDYHNQLDSSKTLIKKTEADLNATEAKLNATAANLKQIETSISFKTGRLLTAIPRKILQTYNQNFNNK